LKSKYSNAIHNQCDKESIDARENWFPRECCDRHRIHDSREPGLMKKEYEGDLFIGLCSKTYILENKANSKLKMSTKGLSRKSLVDPLNQFKKVLFTGVPESGLNKGFRVKNNTIFTYEQSRMGLSYFYCKREVLSDGISTKPLDITLTPASKKLV
jgi:hypothetical protein